MSNLPVCCSLMMDWREAAVYANRLIDESSWSRTVYSYTMGAMLLQLGDKIMPSEKLLCNDLMKYIVVVFS